MLQDVSKAEISMAQANQETEADWHKKNEEQLREIKIQLEESLELVKQLRHQVQELENAKANLQSENEFSKSTLKEQKLNFLAKIAELENQVKLSGVQG